MGRWKKPVFLRRIDLIALLAILFLLTFWTIRAHQKADSSATRFGVIAEFRYRNEIIETMPLVPNQPLRFQLPGHECVTFERAADGSIAFVESDCPDQVCVHTGYLRRVGEFAACLPNDLVLIIRPAEVIGPDNDDGPTDGSDKDDVDLIVGQAYGTTHDD